MGLRLRKFAFYTSILTHTARFGSIPFKCAYSYGGQLPAVHYSVELPLPSSYPDI
jgi:hypothetical protein